SPVDATRSISARHFALNSVAAYARPFALIVFSMRPKWSSIKDYFSEAPPTRIHSPESETLGETWNLLEGQDIECGIPADSAKNVPHFGYPSLTEEFQMVVPESFPSGATVARAFWNSPNARIILLGGKCNFHLLR